MLYPVELQTPSYRSGVSKKNCAAWGRRFGASGMSLLLRNARLRSKQKCPSGGLAHLNGMSDASLRDQLYQALLGGNAHVDTLSALKDFPPKLYGTKPEGAPHSAWDPMYPDCVQYTGCPKDFPVVWCTMPGGHEADNDGQLSYIPAMLKFNDALPSH